MRKRRDPHYAVYDQELGCWKLPLPHRKFTLIDEWNWEFLQQWNWSQGSIQHPSRTIRTPWGKRVILLHLVVAERAGLIEPGKLIDHKNGDPLDNRVANLRAATHAENNRNARRSKLNSSGFKGVIWDKSCCKDGRWIARIKVDGKSIYLGCFTDPAEGAKAYAEASKKYHGEFGRTG